MSSPNSTIYNSVPISIADDEPERKSRLQSVRKRKELRNRRKRNGIFRRLVWKLFCEWWTALLLLLATALLLFEGWKLVHVTRESPAKPDLSSVNLTTLDRLEPTTHFVNGSRQLCLKLLPPEELGILDLPFNGAPDFPVKKVLYLSENDESHVEQQGKETARFNLFTGFQTMEERDASFKVNETVALHCGFYSENGGFKISDEDKDYMKTCKVVVSTCAFGGGDDLYQPIGMSEASLRKVCYVAFWDKVTLKAQQLEGHAVNEDNMVGKWRVVIVRELPFADQRLNGKIPKMLGHRLFPRARFSIWVDSKSQIRRDPLGVLEALLWRTNSSLAISEHGARASVYEEGKGVIDKNKANPEEVKLQLTQYRQDGLPKNRKYNGKKALNEASVIIREHTPMTDLLMCVWFNEVVRFTSRDQLSFPFVLWRLRMLRNINVFPVCTRKDIVNTIGHRRKAKPLKH